MGLIILTTLLLALVVAAFYRSRPKAVLCPKCSGPLDCDPYRYRNLNVWTCRECGETFETLQ